MTRSVMLNYVSEGPSGAPVVVLLHSLGASLSMWEPQARALARTFSVVSCDLRAHGGSPAPPAPYAIADLGADVLAVLDRIGAARAHLCGLSLGGMVSLWLAAHAPERVDRLIVCASSAKLGPASAWAERAALVRREGTSVVAEAIVGRWFTPEFSERNPELGARMRAGISATSNEGYAACCGAIEHMDLFADLAQIRAKTLLLAGAQDPATPPEHLFRIAEGIAGARVEVVESAAHLLNLEQPEIVTALILAHLGGEPSSPTHSTTSR